MTLKMIAAAFGLMLVTAACHKDGGGGGEHVTSCNFVAEHECRQYSDATFEAAGEASLKKTCDDFKGTFAHAPCATDKLVGLCAKREGDVYSYNPATPTDEKFCTDGGGTFSRPAAK